MLAYRRTAVSRRVVVNLKSGESISGTLYAKRGPILILKGAAMLSASGPMVPIDGDVVVERANVAWTQVLPSPEG